jgi:hypothetical protein
MGKKKLGKYLSHGKKTLYWVAATITHSTTFLRPAENAFFVFLIQGQKCF